MKARVFLLALLISLSTSAQDFSDNVVSVPFEAGDSGYSRFRIPALTMASDGSVLAFAEGRKDGAKDSGNIDLVLRRSSDGGRSWAPLTLVWSDGDNTCGNPSPVVLASGRIVLLATWNLSSDDERALETRRSVDTRRVFSLFSDDNGLTWSKPRDITSEVKRPDWTWFATGPCHAIVKRRSPHKGRLIVPSNHKEISDEGEVWSFSQIIYSDDEGEHWHIGAVSQVGGNESSVAELRNGDLCLNMRHTEKKDSLRLYALSRDGGESFYERGQCPDLVEPRCQGSLLNYSFSSRLSRKLLFSGVLSSKSRENLSLSVSTDGGRTWAKTATLFKGASAYSDIVLLDSRRLGVLFENGVKGDLYRRISFSLLDL